MSTTEDDNDNDRDYFRVDDEIHLQYRPLSAEEYARRQENPPDDADDACELMLHLHSLSMQGGNILGAIRKKSHEVAQYLAILDKKIEMVARAVAARHLGQAAHPNARVSLSASGLTVTTAHHLPLDSHLEMRLTLFPSRLCLRTCGRVARCEPQGEQWDTSVEFVFLSENAREALIRHTIARQSALLRQQRSQQEG